MRENSRRKLKLLLGMIALIGAFAVAFALFYKMEFSQQTVPNAGKVTVTPPINTPEHTSEPENSATQPTGQKFTTTLLIGVDDFGEVTKGESYRNNSQADFLLLLVMNNHQKTYRALQINRDTMADITALSITGEAYGTVFAQLALSHTYGTGLADSCENTVVSVSNYLSLELIDNYCSMTMDAIPALNDALGGVAVTFEEGLQEVDPAFVKGETVLLDGQQALNFIRARMGVGDGTNISRMARQHVYMHSLLTAVEKNDEGDSLALKLIEAISPYIVTSYDSMAMVETFTQLREYEFEGIISIDGEAIKGEKYIEFYANKDSIIAAMDELFS